jgi:hypothetical protein
MVVTYLPVFMVSHTKYFNIFITVGTSDIISIKSKSITLHKIGCCKCYTGQLWIHVQHTDGRKMSHILSLGIPQSR